jgi:uncharacterized membrane protein
MCLTSKSRHHVFRAFRAIKTAVHRKRLASRLPTQHSRGMQTLSSLSPQVIIHLACAVLAVILGPFALWARLMGRQRPKLHRAFGYAWVTMMLLTAVSAIFIQSRFPFWAWFSWIHLFIPATLLGLFAAFWFLAKGNIAGHRKSMLSLYFGACIVTGLFTLLPGRFLGQLLATALQG